MKIISVGKLNKEFQPIAEHYKKIIKYQIKFIGIDNVNKLPPKQIKQSEAKLINKHIETKSYNIILDVVGKSLSSHEFANMLQTNLVFGENICFIIGGAFGLDESIVKQANVRLSLSNMTMPHQMAKIVLLEQIYRAQTILENHPYHKN
jgi:23S rRNA (pseudouridine1915-N3)-methyltransferase